MADLKLTPIGFQENSSTYNSEVILTAEVLCFSYFQVFDCLLLHEQHIQKGERLLGFRAHQS